jgi:hypothetical protein
MASMRFRELVTLVMQQQGLPVGTSHARLPSEAFAEPEQPTRSPIFGLDDFVVTTQATASPGRYSESLTVAEALALHEGRKHAAVVAWRSGATKEHFAIMALSDWASLVAEARGKKISKSRPSGGSAARTAKEDSGGG